MEFLLDVKLEADEQGIISCVEYLFSKDLQPNILLLVFARSTSSRYSRQEVEVALVFKMRVYPANPVALDKSKVVAFVKQREDSE